MELAGSFPRRRKISIRSVGWLAAEVEDWIIARQKADLYDKSVA
jgi:predicted DNA-binding transcriptional regulator AlpA